MSRVLEDKLGEREGVVKVKKEILIFWQKEVLKYRDVM